MCVWICKENKSIENEHSMEKIMKIKIWEYKNTIEKYKKKKI